MTRVGLQRHSKKKIINAQLHKESLDILSKDRDPNSRSLEYYAVVSTI